MNQYISGVLFGGTLISTLGALTTYTIEKKEPTLRTVSRDFIIGAVLFVLIMQLLPESSTALLTFLGSYIPTQFPTLSTPIEYEDIDIQVGIPTF